MDCKELDHIRFEGMDKPEPAVTRWTLAVGAVMLIGVVVFILA